jgi:hypothetical protein
MKQTAGRVLSAGNKLKKTDVDKRLEYTAISADRLNNLEGAVKQVLHLLDHENFLCVNVIDPSLVSPSGGEQFPGGSLFHRPRS